MKNNFLFIGPRKLKDNPNKTGGVIILFEDLLSFCENYNINYRVIDTNKANYNNRFFAYCQILFALIVQVPKVKTVSLHGTANDYLLIAPFALLITKLFNKQFTLRKFAGNFIEVYENYSDFQRMVIKKILQKSSSNFFETKYLVEYFSRYNKHTFWFPNVRHKSAVKVKNSFEKRFVYLGAIKKEKGIDILCNASNLLSDSYTIDLYGTLDDGYSENDFDNFNITYRGPLKHSDVINNLLLYDVLILPSLREGYPGVIIEALSIGMPIIATNLPSIEEMIDNSSSVLIDPLNVVQLKEAILSFDENNYQKKSQAALKQFENFDTEIQTKLFFNRMQTHA
jgi:glycosyltransferase involved in cell wall biosynthesis